MSDISNYNVSSYTVAVSGNACTQGQCVHMQRVTLSCSHYRQLASTGLGFASPYKHNIVQHQYTAKCKDLRGCNGM